MLKASYTNNSKLEKELYDNKSPNRPKINSNTYKNNKVYEKVRSLYY